MSCDVLVPFVITFPYILYLQGFNKIKMLKEITLYHESNLKLMDRNKLCNILYDLDEISRCDFGKTGRINIHPNILKNYMDNIYFKLHKVKTDQLVLNILKYKFTV